MSIIYYSTCLQKKILLELFINQEVQLLPEKEKYNQNLFDGSIAISYSNTWAYITHLNHMWRIDSPNITTPYVSNFELFKLSTNKRTSICSEDELLKLLTMLLSSDKSVQQIAFDLILNLDIYTYIFPIVYALRNYKDFSTPYSTFISSYLIDIYDLNIFMSPYNSKSVSHFTNTKSLKILNLMTNHKL